ncbi:UNKNOWN [Stylonychia lemnae]|uniref:Uncharacterized protein n=1 Tax=Stylonychia lemnae TaxID=5949 RepID=A0A077ZQX2_STYLE|nr:UNKNOWN [Stylonychia lemnae]|eukprot:CDW71834.1 UNKNOWN [Stylonychia lemnae]
MSFHKEFSSLERNNQERHDQPDLSLFEIHMQLYNKVSKFDNSPLDQEISRKVQKQQKQALIQLKRKEQDDRSYIYELTRQELKSKPNDYFSIKNKKRYYNYLVNKNQIGLEKHSIENSQKQTVKRLKNIYSSKDLTQTLDLDASSHLKSTNENSAATINKSQYGFLQKINNVTLISDQEKGWKKNDNHYIQSKDSQTVKSRPFQTLPNKLFSPQNHKSPNIMQQQMPTGWEDNLHNRQTAAAPDDYSQELHDLYMKLTERKSRLAREPALKNKTMHNSHEKIRSQRVLPQINVQNDNLQINLFKNYQQISIKNEKLCLNIEKVMLTNKAQNNYHSIDKILSSCREEILRSKLPVGKRNNIQELSPRVNSSIGGSSSVSRLQNL